MSIEKDLLSIIADCFDCRRFVAGYGFFYALCDSPATNRSLADCINIMQEQLQAYDKFANLEIDSGKVIKKSPIGEMAYCQISARDSKLIPRIQVKINVSFDYKIDCGTILVSILVQ